MTTPPIQTLTDELLGEIEACAAKATPGQWWIDSHGHTMIAQESLDVIFSIPFVKGAAVRHPETGNLSQWRNDWDASYIALANPANVTALITELRTLRAENAELRKDAGLTLSDTECAAVQLQEGVTGCDIDCGCPYQKARDAKKDLIDAREQRDTFARLIQEAGKTIHRLQAEMPTTVRIAKYLDAMRAKIDTAMEQAK